MSFTKNEIFNLLANKLTTIYTNVDFIIDGMDKLSSIKFDESIDGSKVWICCNYSHLQKIKSFTQLYDYLNRNEVIKPYELEIYNLVYNLILKEKIENVIKL